MLEPEGNVLSMARIQLIQHPLYGDLISGPAPIVRGTRFQPLQEIRLEVSCRDCQGRLWKSNNAYLVDATGVFDTATTPAVGDSYYGVAPEGPFTSMTCEDGPGHDFASGKLSSILYKLTCFSSGSEIWSHEVTRSLGRAQSWMPKPWVHVLLFTEQIASDEVNAAVALAPYGVAVTHRGSGTSWARPAEAAHSDLPTFIIGCGRASARALDEAIRMSSVNGVILFSGGGLRFDPAEAQETSAEPREYLDLDRSDWRPRAEGIFATRPLYAQAVVNREARDRARIKVEHIACPIFMFSGLDDQIWPSSAFSEMIAQRRTKTNSSFATLHRTFEGVGHDLGPTLGLPTLPTTERTVGHPDANFRLLLGGKMGRQARARRECWDSMLGILSGDRQGPPDEPPSRHSL